MITTAFQVVPNALPPDEIELMAAHFGFHHRASPDSRPNGQSGFRISDWPEITSHLAPLDRMASTVAGAPLKLSLAHSSCRWQLPRAEGALALHQDIAAVGAIGETHICVVAWLPLCAIDDETPGLEICPLLPDRFYEHKADKVGYSIIDDPPDVPLVNLSHTRLGDIVWMDVRTLHRTCVRPWHKKERLSLDLRFLPN